MGHTVASCAVKAEQLCRRQGLSWRGSGGCPYGMKAVLARKYLSQCSGHKHCKFRFRAPRSIEASASIDSTSKTRRSISVVKCTERQQNIVRAPKTAISTGKRIATRLKFRFRAPRSIEASASIESASKKNDVRFQ